MFLFSLLVPVSKDDAKTLFQNCSKNLRYSCDHSSATNEGTYSLRCCTDFKLLITLVYTLSAQLISFEIDCFYGLYLNTDI